MTKMYYCKDANLGMLKGKTVAIIGYGSQGHAHALNLKESGINVIVGLYEGSSSAKKAQEAGLTVMNTSDASKAADIIMILIPDEKQAAVYSADIFPNLKAEKAKPKLKTLFAKPFPPEIPSIILLIVFNNPVKTSIAPLIKSLFANPIAN